MEIFWRVTKKCYNGTGWKYNFFTQNFKANLQTSSARRRNWRRSNTTGVSSLHRGGSSEEKWEVSGSMESRAGSCKNNCRQSSVKSPFKSISIPEAEDDDELSPVGMIQLF